MVPVGPGTHGEETLVAWENRLVRLLRARNAQGITLRRYFHLSIRIKVLTFFLTRYADAPPAEWAEVDEAPAAAATPPEFLYRPRLEPSRPPRQAESLAPILRRIADANAHFRESLHNGLN